MSKLLRNTFWSLKQQVRNHMESRIASAQPRHLICFKQWSKDMVMDIVNSALYLKSSHPDTRGLKLDLLSGSKIMILQEVNQPVLNIAVSKAATLLGASAVNITNAVVWEQDYMGRSLAESSSNVNLRHKDELKLKELVRTRRRPIQFICHDIMARSTSNHLIYRVFSLMADAIFVSTTTHMCVQRFSEQSLVPVLCMHSRTHASIQALATVMTIIEQFGAMQSVNFGYLGPSHPVLNSYLLLCPMLSANIKFKCCCDKSPVSPLLFKASEQISADKQTTVKACKAKDEVLNNANVIIAGPTTTKKEKIEHFLMNVADVTRGKQRQWIFIHSLPRGEEVSDGLFNHQNARTYNMFENMHYIAAALMANAIKGHLFHLH